MAFTFRNTLDVMFSKANWIANNVTARSQLRIRLILPELCRDHEIFTAFGKAKAAAKKGNAALKQDFSQLDKEMLYWTMSSIFLQMAYNRHLNDITYVMGIAAHPKEVYGKIVLLKDVFFEFFDFYMHTPGNLLTQIISGDVASGMMLLMLAQSYLKKTGQTQEQEMLYDSVHCHLQCSSPEELRAFIRFLREAKVNEKTYILTACPNTTKKLPTQIWFPAYVAEGIVDLDDLNDADIPVLHQRREAVFVTCTPGEKKAGIGMSKILGEPFITTITCFVSQNTNYKLPGTL